LFATLRRPDWSAVWCFTLLGILGASTLHPGIMIHGAAHSAFFTSAVLLTVLGWGVLSGAPARQALAVCAGLVAEFLIMFWSHIWVATTEPRVLDPWLSNPEYLDPDLFLHACVGSGKVLFFGFTLLIQLALIVC